MIIVEQGACSLIHVDVRSTFTAPTMFSCVDSPELPPDTASGPAPLSSTAEYKGTTTKGSVAVTQADLARVQKVEFLNDTLIDFYMK